MDEQKRLIQDRKMRNAAEASRVTRANAVTDLMVRFNHPGCGKVHWGTIPDTGSFKFLA